LIRFSLCPPQIAFSQAWLVACVRFHAWLISLFLFAFVRLAVFFSRFFSLPSSLVHLSKVTLFVSGSFISCLADGGQKRTQASKQNGSSNKSPNQRTRQPV
jgi:hypothetical protein